MKIKDFMTRDVITASKEMTVEEFVHKLEGHRISGAPIIDDQNHILGVLSVTDIIRRSKYINNELANLNDYDVTDFCTSLSNIHKYHTMELFKTPIGSMMHTGYFYVSPNDELQTAIDVFLTTCAHRLLVIDDDRLVGVFSIKDAIKALINTPPAVAGKEP